MSTDIDNAAYATLNTYAVLASSGIVTVNTTTITNGFYGSSTPLYTGAIIGTVDSANVTTAQTQLTALVGAINTYRSGLSSTALGIVAAPITLYPNINYESGSAIIFQGIPITLDAQGNSNAQFFITAGSSFTFNNVPSITLINGASNCNIFWLAGTAIEFTGTSPSSIPGIFIAGSAITFANASQILGRLYAQTENVTFSGTSSVNGACTQNIVCYAKGTLILTKNGFVPIENMTAGDEVITKGRIYNYKYINNYACLSLKSVLWIGKFRVTKLNSKSRPICIKKDALGEGSPFKDLYVSPVHCLLLNGKMVLAKNMVNGRTICQDDERDSVEYYHLECESHSAIVANGVLSESYLDTRNRHVFESSRKTQT
jgi:antigen 43